VKLYIVGTDHRLQQSIAAKPGGGWIQRTGGQRFRRCVSYFLSQGVKVICEEVHQRQDEIAPTICSALAKEHKVRWICMGIGEPSPLDVLTDKPLIEAFAAGILPEVIAGRYRLDAQDLRERHMCSILREAVKESGTVLAVVGFMHAGVLARELENEHIAVEAFQMMQGLVLDESQT
jgi:hypothetical protein